MGGNPVYSISEPVHSFFRAAHETFLSPAYEEIRLVPDYSKIHPSQIEIHSPLTRNIQLGCPIISAAMDTVTEAEAAVSMARVGGIGIIHKNFHLDPEIDLSTQVREVARVKRNLHALIRTPIGFPGSATLGHLLQVKSERDYGFDTFIVYGKGGMLAGLITRSVIKYNRYRPEKRLEEIMVRDVFTREACSLHEAYDLMLENRIGNIVLVDSDRKVSGLYTFKDVENVIKNLNPGYTTDAEGRLCVGAAVGVDDMERVDELVSENVDLCVLDSAHGDSKPVIDALKRYKKKYPSLEIMAGNISTSEAAERLIRAGADAIKVGQGPGQICSTRIISGIGVMQPDAIYRCARVAAPEGIPVIADGGIRYSGDIPIALACGASSVMVGQLLAGCSESPGELFQEDGKLYKVYRGMASLEAMSVKRGSDRYQKSATELKKLVPEGITKRIPFKGSLEDHVFMLAEGLKTGMGYCGAKNLQEFKSKARIHRITSAGIQEGHPDTQGMTHQPPNYLMR
jgi:IMP dehydrogenase